MEINQNIQIIAVLVLVEHIKLQYLFLQVNAVQQQQKQPLQLKKQQQKQPQQLRELLQQEQQQRQEKRQQQKQQLQQKQQQKQQQRLKIVVLLKIILMESVEIIRLDM